MNTCEIWCKIWFGKNGPKERGDLDSKQHEEVQADTDEAAVGGDTSDPAEGGVSHAAEPVQRECACGGGREGWGKSEPVQREVRTRERE